MKTNRIPKCVIAFTLALLIAPFSVAGCSSHDSNVPQTLAQQKADVSGPGQIPPDVLAKARATYGQGGSYQQQVSKNLASAAAAKQAANSQPQSQSSH